VSDAERFSQQTASHDRLNTSSRGGLCTDLCNFKVSSREEEECLAKEKRQVKARKTSDEVVQENRKGGYSRNQGREFQSKKNRREKRREKSDKS